MRLLLAHYIVVLTLCRFTSAENVFWSYVDYYAVQNMETSPFSIPNEKKFEMFNKIVQGNVTERQMHILNLHLGNTIYTMMLEKMGMYQNLPPYYREALDNGVLCEVNRYLHEGTIRSIQYYSNELTAEQRRAEIEAAKDPLFGIDCNVSDSDYCFCWQRSALLYCAAQNLKKRIKNAGVVRKVCENELLDSVAWNTSQSFVGFYQDDKGNEKFVRSFNTLPTEWREAVIHCLATDPIVEPFVKGIFSANALRWTLEDYVIDKVFNGTHKDIDSACAVGTFNSSAIGQCACTKDTGISFCINKIRGEYYKKIGYLNCEKNNAREFGFYEKNKPSKIPPFQCMSDAEDAVNSVECEDYRNNVDVKKLAVSSEESHEIDNNL